MKIATIGNPKDSKKRCIISLGVGKKSFSNSIKRLEESLHRVHFNGDFLYWDEHLPEGCPPHFEAPFAFKTYCFNTARKLGYREILWMDSTCIALRSLAPIFADINKHGYILFNNNYDQKLGQWIGDDALDQNGLTRDEAMEIPECPCSVIGLDLQSEIGSSFLDHWHRIMADGVTAKGTRQPIRDWEDYQAVFWNRNQRISKDPRAKGHRCDQPAAGIVAHRLGMTPYSDYLKDIHYAAKPVKLNTVILHHREFSDTITPLNEIYHQVFFQKPFIQKPRATLSKIRRKIVGRLKALGKSWLA